MPFVAPNGTRMLALRPLADLRQACEAMLAETTHADTEPVRHVTAVGGGAAGVEARLATLFCSYQHQPHRAVCAQRFSTGATLWPGMALGAARRADAELKAADITMQLPVSVDDTKRHRGELLLWVTDAEAHPWQRGCDLAVSASRLFRVDRWLRTLSHSQVHAVGYCAKWAEPLPKAGVYAVRLGAMLLVNLRAALCGGTFAVFHPQCCVPHCDRLRMAAPSLRWAAGRPARDRPGTGRILSIAPFSKGSPLPLHSLHFIPTCFSHEDPL